MEDWSELKRRAAEGDRDARGRMLEPFLGDLRTYVRVQAGKALRAHESVSDLVQSVCREILQDLGEVDLADESAMRRWVFKTADRKLVDRARKLGALKRGGGQTARHLASWAAVDSIALGAYSRLVGPIEASIAEETQRSIERALQELDEEDRRVILLARIQELPGAEVALELGRSEGATRVLLLRALAKLAKKLGER